MCGSLCAAAHLPVVNPSLYASQTDPPQHEFPSQPSMSWLSIIKSPPLHFLVFLLSHWSHRKSEQKQRGSHNICNYRKHTLWDSFPLFQWKIQLVQGGDSGGYMICNEFCRTFSRRHAENQVAQTHPEGLKWRQISGGGLLLRLLLLSSLCFVHFFK